MSSPQEPDPAPSLEKIAVEKGWATTEQVKAAQRYQAQKKVSLSQALIALGILTEVQVRRARGGTKPQAAAKVDPSTAAMIKGYRIERRLGSGGMGDVFLAQQISLDRPVALKILPPHLAKDEEFIERFVSEARAAGKVAHENIVAAVDVGESNGRYYFVMELVEGPTLQQTIQREGPIPEKRALEIARQVARGLRHAHQQGLIHRDIKPANIMLTGENVAKICDFGLAREIDADVTLTMPGIVQSSPAYASPEQCRGRQDLDHRTDMYSLGVTLFEMLTAKRPFNADTAGALFIKHATEAPPAPQSLNPAITTGANQLVLRLLRKEPGQRFGSYDQLIDAIDAALKSKPVPKLKGAPVRPVAARRFPWGAVAAAVLILGAAAGGVVFLRPPEKKPEPEVKAKPVETEVERLRKSMADLEQRAAERADEKAASEAARILAEADAHWTAGRPREALALVRSFGGEGSAASKRVAERAAEWEKSLEERYRAGKDKVAALATAGKADEARAALVPVKALEFLRPEWRGELEALARSIDETPKKSEVAAPKAEPQASVKAKEPPPVLVLDHVRVLRTPALRNDPRERAKAAAAFRAGSSRSALNRAAEAFLSHDDRSWKLGGDRLKLKTDQIELDLEGQAQVEEGKPTVFQSSRGHRVVLQKDGRISLNGGTWVLPQKAELQRNLPTPLLKVFGDYIAALPLERADTMATADHQGQFVALAKKVADLGDTPKDALLLFALAHAEELLAQNVRPDPEGLRLCKLQAARTVDFWGAPQTVNRLALARLLAAGGGAQDLRRAADAVSGAIDFPSRLLVALAALREKDVDPLAASAAWKKLAGLAADSPAGKSCDEMAERLKKASACDGCSGQGRYPCKKCNASGIADCDRCKGSGRVRENDTTGFGYYGMIPCPSCKQKARVTCPVCLGGKVARCEKCEGKKVKKTVPAAEFQDALEAYRCRACAGSGGVFTRVGFACPSCDGIGRFPSR